MTIMDKAMSKEEFRQLYEIPRSTFVRCLRMVESDMPPPYTKTQKMLTPAQVKFLRERLC